MNGLDLIKEGGAVMWPLFALFVLTIVIAIERTISYIAMMITKAKVTEDEAYRFLSLLDLTASIAPVLGFLGTVFGMIAAFRSVSQAATVSLQVVASGLYEALYTTAFGLIISLMAAVISHLLNIWAGYLCENETPRN